MDGSVDDKNEDDELPEAPALAGAPDTLPPSSTEPPKETELAPEVEPAQGSESAREGERAPESEAAPGPETAPEVEDAPEPEAAEEVEGAIGPEAAPEKKRRLDQVNEEGGAAGIPVNAAAATATKGKGRKPKSKSVSTKKGKKGGKKGGPGSDQNNQQSKQCGGAEGGHSLPLVPARNGVSAKPGEVHLSDKAPQVILGKDLLSAESKKGYRMVRASHSVTSGAWYFEITVDLGGPTGHTRLGWCTDKGDLQAPVGYDSHSYAYRDIEGSKVHKGLREAYGETYVSDDTIGCYINLRNGDEYLPARPLLEYKGQLMHPEQEDPPKSVPGSEVLFFKNGVCQGVAYSDVLGGRYFPAASMYTMPEQERSCKVTFNFGPKWLHPPVIPEGHSEARAIAEVAVPEKAEGAEASEQAVDTLQPTS